MPKQLTVSYIEMHVPLSENEGRLIIPDFPTNAELAVLEANQVGNEIRYRYTIQTRA